MLLQQKHNGNPAGGTWQAGDAKRTCESWLPEQVGWAVHRDRICANDQNLCKHAETHVFVVSNLDNKLIGVGNSRCRYGRVWAVVSSTQSGQQDVEWTLTTQACSKHVWGSKRGDHEADNVDTSLAVNAFAKRF